MSVFQDKVIPTIIVGGAVVIMLSSTLLFITHPFVNGLIPKILVGILIGFSSFVVGGGWTASVLTIVYGLFLFVVFPLLKYLFRLALEEIPPALDSALRRGISTIVAGLVGYASQYAMDAVATVVPTAQSNITDYTGQAGAIILVSLVVFLPQNS